jgi:predicted GNAT family N-acyltransferase
MMKDLLLISQIEYATPSYDQTVQLRYEILRLPLGLDFSVEELSTEYDSYHLACYQMWDEELIACLVLKPVDDKTIKMRQVAVREDQQSKGVGRMMVAESEKLAKNLNFQKIELHARSVVESFYHKNGYKTVGDTFKEVGIDHVKMEKML